MSKSPYPSHAHGRSAFQARGVQCPSQLFHSSSSMYFPSKLSQSSYHSTHQTLLCFLSNNIHWLYCTLFTAILGGRKEKERIKRKEQLGQLVNAVTEKKGVPPATSRHPPPCPPLLLPTICLSGTQPNREQPANSSDQIIIYTLVKCILYHILIRAHQEAMTA